MLNTEIENVTLTDDFDAAEFVKQFKIKRGYVSKRRSPCNSVYIGATKSGKYNAMFHKAGAKNRVSLGTYDTAAKAEEAKADFLKDLAEFAANSAAQPTPVDDPVSSTTAEIIARLKAELARKK